jgi:hypothetical protein
METEIIKIFEQHLDFLSAEAATELAQRFVEQFEDLCSQASAEVTPPEELSKAHDFLFREIQKLVKGDPHLELRYPDGAITNVVVMLLDDLTQVVPT